MTLTQAAKYSRLEAAASQCLSHYSDWSVARRCDTLHMYVTEDSLIMYCNLKSRLGGSIHRCSSLRNSGGRPCEVNLLIWVVIWGRNNMPEACHSYKSTQQLNSFWSSDCNHMGGECDDANASMDQWEEPLLKVEFPFHRVSMMTS